MMVSPGAKADYCRTWAARVCGGGNECLVALSELYKCTIRTIWENGTTSRISPREHESENDFTIVYRQRVHYDSFLCYENLRTRDVTLSLDRMHDDSCIDLFDEDEVRCDTIFSSQRASGNGTGGKHMKPLTSRGDLSSHCPMTGDTLSVTPLRAHDMWPILTIGTWNVRGANDIGKRRDIDLYLSTSRFGIVALQETKLACRTCDTKNYKWILGIDNGLLRTSRRLAILVHVSLSKMVKKIHKVSVNILAIELLHDNRTMLFINVHMPQGATSGSEFCELRSFILKHTNSMIILFGDFNAHLGKDDLTADDMRYIGPNLYHQHDNDNGDELKAILHMAR